MKFIHLFILAVSIQSLTSVQPLIAQSNEPLRIVAIGAHPDDTDIQFGGTAALFSAMGHSVKFVSLTNGDAGHYAEGGGMLAKRRYAEAQEAARRLGIDAYVVLDNHDAELQPELHIRHQVIREIREWEADVVISHRPNDYHPDHRNTGVIVTDAAFLVIVPNVVPDTPALKKNPLFLYYQDRFQKPSPFEPDIAIDISDSFDAKIFALDAHESQVYEWLPSISGGIEQVPDGDQERIEWLAGQRTRRITPAVRQTLARWYGEDHAGGVEYVEAFEIAEYGSNPSEEEIRRLFPMLPQTP
ncbi:MAG: PIG-L family deacetylase [Balneolaceae bacterium]